MFENQLIQALLTGKPYFGPAMRAMQGPPVRHRYLAALVQALSHSKSQRDIYILEIGSWAGASAITWAKTIQKLGMRGRITCVDPWQPYFDLTIEHESHYEEMTEAAKENKIFNLFLHNIRAANVSDMIDYLIGNARQVLPGLPSEKFDLMYIDGSHTYEDVQSDIRQAKRLIREGGIVCGDDLEFQKHCLDEQEHRTALKTGKDYVSSSSGNYHPGVTEAVAVEFGEVSSWEGVWAVRKRGSKWVKVELKTGKLQIPDHIKSAARALEVTQPEEIELVDATEDFNLVKTKDRFLAVAKKLGPIELFREQLGDRELAPLLFTGKTLEEVRTKSISWETSAAQPVVELLSDTDSYNLLKVGEKFLAVAKSLGPSKILVERLGERELPPVLLKAETFEDIREKALKAEQRTMAVTELVGETQSFNLVKSSRGFLAVAKQLGPTELFVERLGVRELAPLLLIGESLEEVQEKAHASERQTLEPAVELVDEVGSYNVVRAGEHFIAVAKSLGPLNLFRERVGERDLPPLILVATDPSVLRQRIFEINHKGSKNQDLP